MEIVSSDAGSVARSVEGRMLDVAVGRQRGDLLHYENNIEALKKGIQKLALAKERLLKKIGATKRNCSRLIDAAGRQLGYLLHYDNNIEALEKEIQKLTLAKERLLEKIYANERNCEDIFFDFDVQIWLAEVEEMSAEIEIFLEDEVKAKKRCFNPRQRYRFSKEAKKQTLAISDQLLEAGEFENAMSSLAPPPTGSSGTLESRESIKKEIMDALHDDSIRVIGICGMDGVGKTTLVKEIREEAKESKLYGTVAMVDVSKTPIIKNIQAEIASRLGLMLPDVSEWERACYLQEEIENGEQILMILHNVRGNFDLYSIGIPSWNYRKSKTVITSRSKSVCDQMDCQKIFTVGTLSKEESWKLFKEIAGPDVENCDLNLIAREVASKCGGLPIGIIRVARALRNKERREWKDAAKQLGKSSPTNIDGMQGSLFSSLELSYSYLKRDAKTLFLFCSLFPEDSKIPVEVLVRYGVSLRWFENACRIEDARDRAHKVVSILTSSFLLIDDEEYDGKCVKMQDIVRDFAIAIAPKYNHKFMVEASTGLKQWPSRDTLIDYHTAISLMSNHIHEIPPGLECPKLQALLLQRNSELVVPNNFFLGITDLKVLDLSKTTLLPLPNSLSSLAKLRTLYLNYCELDDLSVIGKLNNLEILSFCGSNIKEIPVSFRQLSHLRLLDLNKCKQLELIPDGVIACLGKLEELYMIESFVHWDFEVKGDSRSNVRLVELQALHRLATLQICIPDLNLLPNNNMYFPFQTLANFTLVIGRGDSYHWDKSRFSRIMILLNTVESIPNLTFLFNLEELKIYDNPNLVEICPCQSPTPFFGNLKSLYVRDCKSILNIVPSHLLQRLQNLQTFKTLKCESLLYVFDLEGLEIANGERKMLSSLKDLALADLPQMTKIWRGDHQFLSLSNLKSVRLKECPKLVKLFSPTLLQTLICLKEIKIKGCNCLEEIFEKKEIEDQEKEKLLRKKNHNIISPISLGNLTYIKIWCCYKLKNLFTSSMVKSLVKLRALELWQCSTMQAVVTYEGEKAPTNKMVFPSLHYVELGYLDSLTSFSSGLYAIEFPALEKLYISGCPKMKTFGYGEQVTPKLNKVRLQHKDHWMGNVNDTIQQFFNEQLQAAGSKEVCDQMDCQKIFTVETLSKQESWELFKEIAGPNVENSDINPIAKEVAAECGGLPIAIVTVARALKHKEKRVWNDAAKQLRKSSPANIEGMQGSLFASLELSYSYLESDAKSLFLFCSLFPEDSKITVEVLVRYGVGLRWFENVYTMKDARDRAHDVVSILTSSFLLIDDKDYDGKCVKMHGVVRDFAILIAPKYNHKFMVEASTGLIQWPSRDTLFDYHTAISLMSNHIHEVPPGLEFPKLQALLLQQNSELFVPDNFFLGITDLEVLDLSKTTLLPLPNSLSSLAKLRTLYLNYCELDDLSLIGNLNNLEILSFCGSNIKEIPISFGQLSHLKLLDLNKCEQLKLIPYGVIARLDKLEELYMIESFIRWDSERYYYWWDDNARLVELQALHRLSTLQIYVPDPNVLPNNNMSFLLPNLTKFIIVIGHGYSYNWDKCRYSRNMMLVQMGISQIYDWIKRLLKRTENLYLGAIENSDNIFDDLVNNGLDELKFLLIESCEIKYPLCTVERRPKLTRKLLERAPSFSKLESLHVRDSTSILNIVPSYLLRRLENLKTVDTLNCESLVNVFDLEGLEIADGETKILSSLEDLTLANLPEMTQIWKGLNHRFISLYNLKRVALKNCFELVKLFSQVLPQSLICLENIEVESCDKLEEIFEQREVEDQKEGTPWNKDCTATLSCLGNLTDIHISNCLELKILFTTSIISVKSLGKLNVIRLHSCSKLQEIITNEEGEKGASTRRIVFSSLSDMDLQNLEFLTCFIGQGLYTIEFPVLTTLNISKCSSLKTFYYRNQVTNKLNDMAMEDKCGMGKQIYENSNLIEKGRGQPLVQSFGKLKHLYVEYCNSMLNIIPSHVLQGLQNVETFKANDCKSVVDIFDLDGLEKANGETKILSSLEDLTLADLPEMTQIWKGIGNQFISLYNLKKVALKNCFKLMKLFSQVLPQSLICLENIEVESCHKLEEIFEQSEAGDQKVGRAWNKDFTTTSPSLRNLTNIHISNCFELKILFTASIISVKSLGKLRVIKLHACSKLQEIITNKEWVKGASTRRIIFSSLYEMDLQNLEYLTCFIGQGLYTIEFPVLETLNISRCSSLKTFYYRNQVTPELNDMDIGDGCGMSKQIYENSNLIEKGRGQPLVQSFGKLKHLYVEYCNSMLNIIPSHVLQGLQNVETFKANDCKSVVDIFDLEGLEKANGETKILSSLEDLKLADLPEMTQIWKGIGNQFISLYNLKKVALKNCFKLMKLFSQVLPQSLICLENIEVESCHKLEEIFEQREAGDQKVGRAWNKDFTTTSPSLGNLTNVHISNCFELKILFTASIISVKSLGKLRVIKLHACSKLQEIITNEEGEKGASTRIIFSSLSEMDLQNLEYLTCFIGQGLYTIEFPVLETLNIFKCSSLKTFYYRNQVTPNLNDMDIGDGCQILGNLNTTAQQVPNKQIYDNPNLVDVSHGQPPAQSFGNLKHLCVRYCNSMLNIIPSYVLQGLQNIETLKAENCDSVVDVFDLEGLANSNGETKMLSSLKGLYLSYLPQMIQIWKGDHHLISLCNLKNVRLYECENLIKLFSPVLLQSLICLEKIDIAYCSNLEEIFEKTETEDKEKGMMLWKNGHAKISPSLGNLTEISVRSCHKLKSLFTPSIANSLVKLQKLYLYKCPTMQVIVTDEEGEKGASTERIVFPSLREMDLLGLDSLTYLSLRLYAIEFPALENLRVFDCPKLKTFSYGEQGTLNQILGSPNLFNISHGQSLAQSFSKLERLYVRYCNSMLNILPSHLAQRLSSPLRLEVENCESVVHIFDLEGLEIANGETKMLSSLKYLKLKRLAQMTQIWKGDHQFISLCNLRNVTLKTCPKLTKLFSLALLPSLICLEEIEIRRCGDLEEIFEKREAEDQEKRIVAWNKDNTTSSSPSLGSLTSIFIHDCAKLKYLFTFSIVKSLVKLKSLRLFGCSTIQEIITNKEEKEASTERMVFPSLYEIELGNLNNLACFSSGSYAIEFPVLERLRIFNCPKMETFCYGDQVTPKLHQVNIASIDPNVKRWRWGSYDYFKVAKRWNGNLTATLKQIFNEHAGA